MHRHGTAISTPPPLQPLAAFSPSSPQRTLSYRCLSTSAPAAAQQRRQDECSVVKFALCGDDEKHGTYSLSGASADNISPADVHAFFAHPLHEERSNISTGLTAHHPVFLHRCSRCTCRLFDVLLGDEGQQRQSNDTLSSHIVQRLHEAVSLAVTAHTETLPSTFNAHPHVAAIAEKVYCVFFRLLPPSVWPLVSLGLTLTSEEGYLLGEAGDTGSAETHSGCLRLHWSWVAGPFARPALQQGSLFSAPLCDSSACEHLWQHWVAGVTQTQRRNAAAREEDARYGDVSAAHQRLHTNAERAQFFLLSGGDVHGSRAPTEDEKKAVQLCAALLAVLVEAKVLEAYWASPHTPLCMHSPRVLERYLVVWFTFLGGALQRTMVAVHVEAAVRAALLHERFEEKASLPVLLRVVCRWATTALLSSLLQSMPSRLHLSVQPSVLRTQRETHLLFRGGEGSSGANSVYHDPVTPTQYNDQNKRQQLASPQERALTRLLDKLYSCAMECEELSNTRTTPSRSSDAVVLTHSLFTHPAQHGVTVCRLHLYTPPQHGVVPLSASSPVALVRRRVVAALLTWYAVDFEVGFWQSYCCWALARRYGAPEAVKDREAASCVGVRVDAAIVCHGARSQSISSLHDTACGGSAPPLGLLGRCLLLALWMQLQLVDVDRREDTEALQLHRAFTTCGTLFYSSRRCVLFVRDWRTVRHLHSILAGTSCDIMSVCNVGASSPPLVGTAAANVALAFLRARRSQLRVHERHHGAVAMALRESVLREQAKQHKQARTLRAVAVVQAWMRAKLSCRDVQQLHNDAVALAAEESREEGSCVLLHWSAVEDASLSSLESIRTPPALKREAAAASDAVQWPLTPSRNLANASSFEVSVEDCLTLDSVATPLSCDSPESLPEAFPIVTLPLTLGQRHLVELEAHTRALLIRVQLSEMLWFTVLIECVGRRACEEGEARAWRRLKHLAERSWKMCAAAAVRRRSAETVSGGSRGGGQSLHEDEAAPVTTLLPASLPPLSNVTIDAAEKQLQQRAFIVLCCDENAAREALHEAEAGERVGLSDVHQQRHAQCLLVAEEALQRSLIVSMWSLAQEEWQSRWSVLIVPECVLRNLYAETFAQERPRGTATTTKNNTISQHEPACVPQKKHIGHTPQRLQRLSLQPTSLADVAKAHRAFLLQEEGEDGEPTPGPPVLLPRPTAPVSSTPQRRRLTRASSSPVDAASTATTTAAAAAAPSSFFSSGAHRRVPVIAVSLCDGEEESKATVPLQVRPVNQPPSPKQPFAATSLVDAMKAARRRAGGNVGDDSADAGDAASCGWWYVPVTPCSRKNSSARKGTGDVKIERSPLQPREGPRPLFRTASFPHSVEQRTAVTSKKPTAPDEDAASVVAAAIALARDSGQPAVGARSHPPGAGPRRSVLQSQRAPSAAPPSLTRPPRKRYVTWADDVEEH